MTYRICTILFAVSMILSCQSDDNDNDINLPKENAYFPPTNSAEWATTSPESLGWDTVQLSALNTYLKDQNSKSFMVLVNGKIVIEEYYNEHNASATWQWNSASKTLVTAMTGIAQQNGFININNKVSDYVDTAWTSTTSSQESLITVKDLLSMTSGLDDKAQLVTKAKLTYKADAGTRWAYGNVFQKLMDVVEDASGSTFETYFKDNLQDKIGMTGAWNNGLIYRIYHSDTRSAARFGLLAANNGLWDGQQIINEDFFIDSKKTSQDINPSYGYLWWLNGKSKFMLPNSQTIYSGELVSNAPSEMVAAMGKDDQRIYIVPSQKLVIVRMGESTEDNFAVSSFDNDFWEKFNKILD